MTRSAIYTEKRGASWVIVLNRPQSWNSLNRSVAYQFARIVDEVAADPAVRVLTIRGAGPVFCAGLDFYATHAAAERSSFIAELAQVFNQVLTTLSELPVVVITAVHGMVAGSGLGILLAGDIVLAAPGTRFLATHNRYGLTPDCGLIVRLPAAIGTQRALSMLVAGQQIESRTAQLWGLVTEIVTGATVAERAAQLASEIIATAPRTAGYTRQLVRAAESADLRQALSAEASSAAMRIDEPESQRLLDYFAVTQERGVALRQP